MHACRGWSDPTVHGPLQKRNSTCLGGISEEEKKLLGALMLEIECVDVKCMQMAKREMMGCL